MMFSAVFQHLKESFGDGDSIAHVTSEHHNEAFLEEPASENSVSAEGDISINLAEDDKSYFDLNDSR